MKLRFISPALLGLALLATGCISPALGNYFAPTAAVVNGEKIPESKLALQIKRALLNKQTATQFRGPQGAKNQLDAQRESLNQLLRQELIAQEGRALGIKVAPGEIAEQVKQLEQRNGGPAKLKREAEKQGFTLAQVREFFADQLLVQKVAKEITKKDEPDEATLRAYYDQNSSVYQDQVHAAHVLICGSFDAAARKCNFTPEDETTARKVTADARRGTDFAELAKKFSVDTSNKDKGGDLGFFRKGQMVPEFEQAAFAMKVGDISDPVKTDFGFHVIKVIAHGRSFEDTKEEILQTVFQQRQQQSFQAWLADVVAKAKIVVNPKFGHFDKATQTIVADVVRVPAPQPGGSNIRVGGGARP